MEYVVVTYAVVRKVRIDTLMVEKGNHSFDLGDPQDYQPATVKTIVQSTTSVGPMMIKDFHPLEGIV